MPLSFSHAALQVQNMDLMVDYYTTTLGFAVSDRGLLGSGGPEIVFLTQDPGEHHQLAFVAASENRTGSGALNHLAFRVESIGELRGFMDRIASDGRGRPAQAVTHGNTWSAYFADPEGNGVEVFCDTPWHVPQPQGQAWDTTLDDPTLHRVTHEAFRSQPGFGPGDAYAQARTRAQPESPEPEPATADS